MIDYQKLATAHELADNYYKETGLSVQYEAEFYR